MDYFRNIRDFMENSKAFILRKSDIIKKAALPIILIAALLIFFLSGTEETVTVSGENTEHTETEKSASGSIENSDSDTAGITEASGFIYVDIGGEVNSPGVYEVSEGTRLFQVIEKAGGLTEEADINVINRAESVYDGQKILIASYEETEAESESTDKTSKEIKNGGASSSSVNSSYNNGVSADTDETQVNINTADSVTLQTIPGIGPSKAERIIEYRSTNGSFKSIDDIKNISGIGNKTFESIKKYLTV